MTETPWQKQIPFEIFDRFMCEAPPDVKLSLDPAAVCPCGAHEGGAHVKGCPLAEAASPEKKWSAVCPCGIGKGGTHEEGCPLGASIDLARSHGIADSHLIHDLSELDAFMRRQ